MQPKSLRRIYQSYILSESSPIHLVKTMDSLPLQSLTFCPVTTGEHLDSHGFGTEMLVFIDQRLFYMHGRWTHKPQHTHPQFLVLVLTVDLSNSLLVALAPFANR